MIKIKLEQDKNGKPIFKLNGSDEEIKGNKMIWRATLEGKKISGEYNYKIPIRFFVPLVKNLNKDILEIDTNSITSYLEFSDECDGKFYYAISANSRYMKNWRDLGCPNIYKIDLNFQDKSVNTKIAFKKLSKSV